MGDLISRQAAIKAINDLPNCRNGYSDTYDKACIIGMLEEVPSVGLFSTSGYVTTSTDGPPVVYAEQKHGKWIVVEYNDGTAHTECSVCGYGRGLPPVRNYCPNCGAKMERSEE